MKIKFDANLDFQQEAIHAIADIFDGQEICQTNFTVAAIKEAAVDRDLYANDLGIGNRLKLIDEDLLSNVNRIQLRNGLAPSTVLKRLNFTVEMETGTGKTYVYLRSIFELNRKYGFTKFIVVVPSIAVKEGVFKALRCVDRGVRSPTQCSSRNA